MENTFLDGEGVYLRGLRRDDLEAHRKWLDDPAVTHFMEMGWRPTSDADLDEVNLYVFPKVL